MLNFPSKVPCRREIKIHDCNVKQVMVATTKPRIGVVFSEMRGVLVREKNSAR